MSNGRNHYLGTPSADARCVDPEWQELTPLYALDALDEPERSGFELHLETCAFCQREVTSFQIAANAIEQTEPQQPPPGLKDDVLAAVRLTPQLPPLEDRPSPALAQITEPVTTDPAQPVTTDPAQPVTTDPVNLASYGSRSKLGNEHRTRRLLAAAAAVIAVAVGGAAWFRSAAGSPSVDDRFAEVAAATDASVIELDGADLNGGGSVTVTWSATRNQVAVEVSGLAPVDEGETYALWLISDGDPVAAALFDDVDDGVALVTGVDDLEALAWGVTIEPAGGSPQPTSDILFLG